MPERASGDARLPSAGSDLKASQAPPGQSLLRKGQSRLRRGQFRFAGKHRQSRKRTSRGSLRSREKSEREKPVRLELRRHKNLFDLTLTKNREQIIPLERRTLFSLWRLPALLG
ncbi:hypothetical protein V511_10065 [Mesotoga sp. Brook.08.YT.4.2.5.1]|nr:hypothetical protein V511_10065 [Mesotoga sp. Brook.08.YT.4.2.5.1]